MAGYRGDRGSASGPDREYPPGRDQLDGLRGVVAVVVVAVAGRADGASDGDSEDRERGAADPRGPHRRPPGFVSPPPLQNLCAAQHRRLGGFV